VIPIWTEPREAGLRATFSWGGFAIDSNLDLPRLSPTDAAPDLGFTWRFDAAPPRRPALRHAEITPRTGGVVRVETGSGGQIRYQVEPVGLYDVRAEEKVIDFFPSSGADPMQVEHHLVNAVLPIYSGLRSVVCLHASAAVEDGRATVFAGPSGCGKSTRAWNAIAAGGALLGDDAVALRRDPHGWLIHPCATTLRLAHLPAVPSWRFGSKREAHVTFATTPVRLGQLVVLDRTLSPAFGSDGGVGLFRSLLQLQAGWVWGDARTRRSLMEVTSALCEWIERRRSRPMEPSGQPPR
jgi:hypothetical protein